MASYSRRINRPDNRVLNPTPSRYDQLNYRVGNPSIEPEYINSFELGYQKEIGKAGSVSVETYYREVLNSISRISELEENNIMRHTYTNLDRDYSIGVEMMANVFLSKALNINLTGTLYRTHIDGEIQDNQVNKAANAWDARMMTNYKLPWGSKFQLMGYYSAPSITAQGERGAFFTTSAGLRQEFKNHSFVLQIQDIFNTMKFSIVASGENFYNEFNFKRESTVVILTYSYRINNYKPERKNGAREIDMGGRSGNDDM